MSRAPGFVGRSKLKQKGRKNTMLCSVRGMKKPYWTALTKTDVCHSTEGYIQTRIKTASAQCKGQYKVQHLAVTTASYLQESAALEWSLPLLGISPPTPPPIFLYWYFPPVSAEKLYWLITSKHSCAHIFNLRTSWEYVATHCFPSILKESHVADGMGISQLYWRWFAMTTTTKTFGCSETVLQRVNSYEHSCLLSE